MRSHKYKGEVYEGNGAYAFISYAHKDEDIVLPVLSGLYGGGLNLWFDDGIIAGSEWPEYLAEHIEKSAIVIAFISANSASSEYCKREIHFALKKGIQLIAVYIDDAKLSSGLEMQLAPMQGVKRKKFDSDDDMVRSMLEIPSIVSILKDKSGQSEDNSAEAPIRSSGLSDSIFDIELTHDEEYLRSVVKDSDCSADSSDRYIRNGNFADAVNITESAIITLLKVHRKNEKDDNDINEFGRCVNNLGRCYEAVPDYSKAEYYYEKAISIFEYAYELKPSNLYLSNTVTALTNVSKIYRKDQKIETAVLRIRRAYELLRPYLNDKGFISAHGEKMVDMLNEYGECMLYVEDYSKAEKMFRESVRVSESRIGNPFAGHHPHYEAFDSNNNLARALELLGDKESFTRYKTALNHALKYHSLEKTKSSSDAVILAYNNLIHIYTKAGNTLKVSYYRRKNESFKKAL